MFCASPHPPLLEFAGLEEQALDARSDRLVRAGRPRHWG
jgi:hypothetical protein